LKLKEETQMKTRKSITYLFRGLVLGTLMIAAIGVYFGAISSGAGDDLSSRDNQLGIAAPSSHAIEASQAASYWIQRDEIEEMAYDELSRNFVGIPAPSSQTQSSFRIMEEQRAADRQEDLKDMIRYWNQLKK
jgi:hypothetical protein